MGNVKVVAIAPYSDFKARKLIFNSNGNNEIEENAEDIIDSADDVVDSYDVNIEKNVGDKDAEEEEVI